MRRKVDFTIQDEAYGEFCRIVPEGRRSGFMEEQIIRYINFMRMKYWLFCPKCQRKTHIRVAMINGGVCQFTDCNAKIMEKIENE